MAEIIRVWTQFSHNLMANIWTIARKLALSFSYLVNLLMSFMVQKNRSTMFELLPKRWTKTVTV